MKEVPMKSLLRQAFPPSNPIPGTSFRSFSTSSLPKPSLQPHPISERRDLAGNNPSHPQPQSRTPPPPSSTSTNTHSSSTTKTPLDSSDTDTIAANCVAGSHLKSGSPSRALHLLGRIPHPNLVSWNLMISCYNRSFQFDGSLRTFRDMLSLGIEPNQFTYGSIFSACVASRDLGFGRQVCSLVMKNGLFSDRYVSTGLIDLFGKNGCFDDALRVFDESPSDNVVCWNAIIAGGVRNGENLVALEFFYQMVKGLCMPNSFTFPSVLSACAGAADLGLGRGVHAWVVKCDVKDDVFVGTAVVDLYAKCGDMISAVKEFNRMPVRNVVSWTAVISGFVHENQAVAAVEFFKQMIGSTKEFNKCTLTSVLMACSKSVMVKEALQIHCLTLKTGLFTDPVVKDALISTYAALGDIQMSEKVFENTDKVKSLGAWSAMISGLAQNQDLGRSLELLKAMFCENLQPDPKCISSVLSIVNCVDFGRQIHSYTVKSGLVLDVLVGSALSTMYSKCSNIQDSFELFRQMEERDKVSWTSMISGFAGHDHADEALQLFREMVLQGTIPDQVTISAVLAACCSHQFLMKGKEIHGYAVRVGIGDDSLVGSALLSMYSRYKHLVSARRVFNGVKQKDALIWSCLVSGYATNGYDEEALSGFHQMVVCGFELDYITISSVIGVCAHLVRPSLGTQLQGNAIKTGLIAHIALSTALVTMYTKCGSLDDSRKVFDEVRNPDQVTWTAMVDAYAQHGNGVGALQIFQLMIGSGIKPDAVTFVTVLSACSHCGLVEEAFFLFNSMSKDYGIEPVPHHYASMVDLLGRSGRLKEAAEFISRMPIKPDSLIWSTLLASCRAHGDVDLARIAAKNVLEMEPRDSGTYISLSNISAEVGDWGEVMRIRGSMKEGGMKKEPGLSLV